MCDNAYAFSQFSILQALYGVYAKDVHVRMACLIAVKCIPAVANRSLPKNTEVATSIWIALHDPEKVWSFLLNEIIQVLLCKPLGVVLL